MPRDPRFDILFEPFVVKRAMESDHDISVIVDIDWRDYYIGRKDHPLSEAENVIFQFPLIVLI